MRGGRRVLAPICLSTTLAGCAIRGAPTYPIVGAFFPGWMFCAVIGIVGAMAARGLFVATGLNRVLPFQLFVCASLGVIIAALAWILWFGQ
ncbi:MAG: YtcA family lipoprotein [Methylocystis sp.]